MIHMVQIAIDLDSVLAQTVPAMLRLFNQEFGTAYTKEVVSDYEFWKVVPELREMKVSKAKDKFYRLLDKAWEDWQSIEPEPGAVEAMQRLADEGHEIDIVTGRETTPREVLEQWLRWHRIPYNNLIVVGGKQQERKTGEQKADMPYDVFIDDNPFQVGTMANYPDKTLLLFTQPWNRNYPLTENVIRVYGWPDALHKLTRSRFWGQRRPDNGSVLVQGYPRHI